MIRKRVKLNFFILLIFSFLFIAGILFFYQLYSKNSLHGETVYSASVSASAATSFILWGGESSQSRVSGLFWNGKPVTNGCYSGNWCFQTVLSKDSGARISLEGQDSYRKDLSGADEIGFYAKANVDSGITLDISLETWIPFNHSVTKVNIGKYLASGSLNRDYQFVRIPLSDFKNNSSYPLSSGVDAIIFTLPSLVSSTPQVHIDQIMVLDNTPLKISSIEILSNRVIRIRTNDAYNFSSVANLNNYKLWSNTDPSFSSSVSPVKAGRQIYLAGFKNDHISLLANPGAPNASYELYLIFDNPLYSGHNYTLIVKNMQDSLGHSFPQSRQFQFQYEDWKTIGGSVKTNQVGYLPDSPKYAYVGNYLGEAGALPVESSLCEIRDSFNNQALFRSQTQFRGEDIKLSGEIVYECDFSTFNKTGSYYVYVQGYGRTYPFKISEDVYNDVFLKTARMYYYQRAGIALEPKYAEKWARAAGHIETDKKATIHSSQKDSPLYAGEVIGSTLDMSRGWYDAGDYGKYVITAPPSVFPLFSAYELYPEKFSDAQLNIPESGNGIPDILDELKWEIDWVKNMQSGDGGVFDRVVTRYYALTMPEGDLAQRNIAEKTTQVTADYAAMLAMAARVFKSNAAFEKTYPGYTSELLARAEKAWQFLENHPNTIPAEGFTKEGIVGGGTYVELSEDGIGSDVDNRAWAAAELYKTTGKQKYHNAFVIYWTKRGPLWGWNEFQHHQRKASWAYATTKFSVNNELVNKYLKDLKLEIERPDVYGIKFNTLNNVYRNGYRSDVPSYIGWGSFAKSSTYAWELIQAAYLIHNSSYIEYAKINLDAQLGNNPQYFSYITGVGFTYPKDPLSTISALDGIDEPLPGLAVYGPYYSLEQGNIYKRIALSGDYLYPAGKENGPYPILRRYFDISEMVEMNEYGVGDSAPGVAVFAYFSENASFGQASILNPNPVVANQSLEIPTNTTVSNSTIMNTSQPNPNNESYAPAEESLNYSEYYTNIIYESFPFDAEISEDGEPAGSGQKSNNPIVNKEEIEDGARENEEMKENVSFEIEERIENFSENSDNSWISLVLTKAQNLSVLNKILALCFVIVFAAMVIFIIKFLRVKK